MATDKNILKGWFSNYKKPTQEQFWAWLESYWHKGEKIPVSELEGLNELLAAVQTPIVTDTYLIQVSLQGNQLRLVMSNEQVFEVDLSGVVGGGSAEPTSVSWNDIEDVPSTFTPSVHTHDIDDVTGLQQALNGKADVNHTHVVNWNEIQGKPSTYPSNGITEAPTDNKLYGRKNGTWAVVEAGISSVNWSDVQGKPQTFPPSSHPHAISDVNNLQTILNNKADVNHTHTIPQITGLQQALNGKADVNHIHTLEPLEITQNTILTATHNNRILMIKGGNINLTLQDTISAGFTGCGIDVVEGRVLFGVGQNMTLTGFSANELNKDEKAYLYRMKPNEHNFRLV